MLKSQELEKIIKKFNTKSTVAKEARISIKTPDGRMWDIESIFLAENKIIGARESHRIVIKVITENASPGRIIKKL
jgi:hypothetical protein|tara:strand:+ start:258 stop:485 length:228 start_codon:yes stop_codon:yes gene_type:complete